MARTKASVGAKVAAGKSNKARCSAAPPPSIPSTSGTSDKAARSGSGGNPVCPRETPKWQKPITNFFLSTPSNDDDSSSDDDHEENSAGPSKPKNNRNVITSDAEDEPQEQEPPKNQVLDETIDLEPLNGESSHKMDEYYSNKDKGKGKKSNKENLDLNGNRNNGKRSLEETEEPDHVSKRVKIS